MPGITTNCLHAQDHLSTPGWYQPTLSGLTTNCLHAQDHLSTPGWYQPTVPGIYHKLPACSGSSQHKGEQSYYNIPACGTFCHLRFDNTEQRVNRRVNFLQFPVLLCSTWDVLSTSLHSSVEASVRCAVGPGTLLVSLGVCWTHAERIDTCWAVYAYNAHGLMQGCALYGRHMYTCLVYYVFRSVVALHSFGLQLCIVKYLVQCAFDSCRVSSMMNTFILQCGEHIHSKVYDTYKYMESGVQRKNFKLSVWWTYCTIKWGLQNSPNHRLILIQ